MVHRFLKICYFSVLFCLCNTALFGMEQSTEALAQSGISLQGKLRPVAELLERNIKRAHEIEGSHPAVAASVLKGNMVIAKELLLSTPAIVDAAANFTYAGDGADFILNRATRFANDIRRAIPLSEETEYIVVQGVDELANRFMLLDGTIDNREAKILASNCIGSMLTAAEFELISPRMFQNFGRGEGPSRASAQSLADSQINQLEIRSRARVPHNKQAKQPRLAGDPAVAKPADTAKKLSTAAQDDFSKEFAQMMHEDIQEDLATSRHLMQHERNHDQSTIKEAALIDAGLAVQAKIAATKEAEFKYRLTRNTLADSFDVFSTLLSIAGDHKAARQIAALGGAGIKLMDSCHMLATGTALVGAAKGIALSPMAPFVGIASAVATLLSVFGDDDEEDGNQQISRAINQMYHALFEQISQVHEHMMIRFDGLEHKVDDMHLHMVQGFLHLNQQMRDFHASQVYSFEKVNSDLQTLHTINAKVDALLLRPFILSCTDIERFASRSGSLANMEEREAKAHCKSLENGLLGIDPTHDLLNGHVCADFTPITMNRILKSISLQALLGYLAQYSAAVLCQPLPGTVRPKELPNAGLFAIGAEKYLALRQATTHIPYDEQCQALQDISHVGEHALGYIDSVQNNRALFEKLLANYKVSYTQVQAICAQAFEKQGQELLDRVHTNALSVNREKLGLFNYPAVGSSQSMESFLSGKHAEYKQCVSVSVDWIAQNKRRFQVPLLYHKVDLLVNPDNTILNAIVMAHCDSFSLYQHFPLSFREKAGIVERIIPMEAIIAERLGLGIITMQYTKAADETTFSLVIWFNKKLDAQLISLGVASLSGISSDPKANAVFAAARNRALTGLMSQVAPLKLRSMWTNATVSSWTPVAGSRELLSTIVDTELVSLRKAAVAQLLAQTELGTAYARALEELDACYNALVAFGTVAGFSEQEKQAVERLVNKNSFMTYHQHYCAAPMSEADNALLVLAPGTLEATSAIILARFAPQAVPATAAAVAQRENAFATPLRVLLARIGHFANIYPEVARQTREEVARRAAETAERARQAQAAAQPAQPADLVQRNQHLEGMVTNLSEQVARLTAMMQQLLVQRVAQ